MRKIIAGIVCVCVLMTLAPVVVSADAEDPFLVDRSLRFIDCPVAGTYSLEIIIHNKSGQEKIFGVSGDWWQYTYPGEGSEWIDPSWITSIIPESQILPVNGKMIVNVSYTIPESAMNKQFKTWLRVYDEPNSLDKPITIMIRTGDQIPTYRFASSPAFYRLRVYGRGASIVVDDAQDKGAPPISVRSECAAPMGVCVSAETPGKDIVISADSEITHSDDEIGLVFQGLSTEVARLWFTSGYTFDNPLVVPGFGIGFLTWRLEIPDDVPNGHYAMGLRVEGAEAGGGVVVGINHVIWLLVEVDRDTAPVLSSGWITGAIGWLGNNWMVVTAVAVGGPVVLLILRYLYGLSLDYGEALRQKKRREAQKR